MFRNYLEGLGRGLADVFVGTYLGDVWGYQGGFLDGVQDVVEEKNYIKGNQNKNKIMQKLSNPMNQISKTC